MLAEQCLRCKWARPISGGCEAFPDNIPFDIGQGVEAHNKVLEGQRGNYVFEAGEPEGMDIMNFAKRGK